MCRCEPKQLAPLGPESWVASALPVFTDHRLTAETRRSRLTLRSAPFLAVAVPMLIQPSPTQSTLAVQRVLSLDGLLRPTPPQLAEQILDALRSIAAGRGDDPLSPVHRSTGAGAGTASEPKVLPEAALTMEQLVQEHSDAVYRVALSVTGDPTLAEDVSQDALIKAWQSLPSYRGESPLRHWILRIAHNTAISALRRRREVVVSPLDLPEGPARGPSVDTQVQDRMAIDRFEAALADLDSISRSIVVLREVEGLSYVEMSNVLELPLPTIRTRLLRARRQLAEALDGWQP